MVSGRGEVWIDFEYLNTGEFEALGYPKTLAIRLSGEASKVQGGRAGVFIQVTMIYPVFICVLCCKPHILGRNGERSKIC